MTMVTATARSPSMSGRYTSAVRVAGVSIEAPGALPETDSSAGAYQAARPDPSEALLPGQKLTDRLDRGQWVATPAQLVSGQARDPCLEALPAGLTRGVALGGGKTLEHRRSAQRRQERAAAGAATRNEHHGADPQRR